MLHLIEALTQKLGEFLRSIQLHIATVAGYECFVLEGLQIDPSHSFHLRQQQLHLDGLLR